MKKFFFLLPLFILTTSIKASPLHLKLKHDVIVDTDCNDSDLRAISILLSHPGINLKAVMLTKGKTDEKSGYKKIRELLHYFDADTIAIINDSEKSSVLSIRKILLSSKEELIILCLGPLTTTIQTIERNRDLHDKIEEVIWYNESVNPLKGFNYEYDKASADLLINSGIKIDIISCPDNCCSIYGPDFVKKNRKSDTKLARYLRKTHALPAHTSKKSDNEELAAIYSGNHELFEIEPFEAKKNVRHNKGCFNMAIENVMNDMVTGVYRTGHFTAFYDFPVHPELYAYDVREILDSAIALYGIEEWKACVITDEFHGHLGVFSIVGAKMGIYAREFFGIGTDLLDINSYAGSEEPFSCMNDGLQVSTGATLGQGTIHLVNDYVAKPQAVFTYKNKSILISLKQEYLIELQKVIKEGIKNYGLQDEDYWNLIRQTSIKFWLEWDRKKIFDIAVL
ncbi:MAG: FmdE family protein [Bacteroidales bacterium]|nr:FmdE family protein [Bacteroidales bacterium]